ncbi:MAG: ATP-dependent metallopeptidase FtsH/Yme1/Tma family protein [Parcubacteria group bacterium]|nr:ATP-dependent metallopeptidase FtsH/Yme1/Tma family protein [Parcubacteria group bacterium]
MNKKQSFAMTLFLGFMLLMFLKLLETLISGPGTEINYTAFKQMVNRGEISSVKITDDGNVRSIIATTAAKNTEDKRIWKTYAPSNDAELLKLLEDKKVEIKISTPSGLWTLLINWGPMLLLIMVWLVFMGKMAGGNAMGWGKSKAKLYSPNSPERATFNDVDGVDEAKEELQDVIAFLKDPYKFTRLGGRVPKGTLLIGPPGTGKTLLARAVAGEAGVPFFSVSGSEFVEMFVGVGAARVRDTFAQAKQNAPCIIFFDEIDVIGKSRGDVMRIGGHDEREQTLQQLLTEMDGFEPHQAIIIIAATNRPDVIDPALLRPGRFDRRVYVSPPEVKGREAILRIHAKKLPKISKDVDLSVIARGTPGLVGADLEVLVNEAALAASKKNKEDVTMADFEEAKDRALMGTERKSVVMSEDEKRTAAYHEAGHALVAKKMKSADPIHKVSIIPRGMALGVTQQLPQTDKHQYNKEELLSKLTILYGGRAAEQIVLNSVTTGAQNDFEHATELAERMVKEWGMSELGARTFRKQEAGNFLMREYRDNDCSEETKREVDNAVKKIVKKQYKFAEDTLRKNLRLLHKIAARLLEKETIDGAELDELIEDPA